jgi:hypothetical protein
MQYNAFERWRGHIMKAVTTILATAALIGMNSFANAACTTDTPVSLWGQGGSNGLFTTDGVPGPVSADSAVGAIDNGGAGDGTAHFKGTTNCDDDFSDSNALAAALSQPVWLGDSEKFAFAGGLGFTDGSTAVGGTAILRLGKNLSGYAGGAVNTNNSDMWAGKAGLRVGW